MGGSWGPGGVGVFAGDWAWVKHPDRGLRAPMGFVGVLIDTWDGWAVFSCTRDVAEAIVADQQRIRDEFRDRLEAEGHTGDDLTQRLNDSVPAMWFDGQEIVIAAEGGPEDVDRISPGPDGRYVVQGWTWTWMAVDPANCDRIAGVIPLIGEQQLWVALDHTDMRVPTTGSRSPHWNSTKHRSVSASPRHWNSTARTSARSRTMASVVQLGCCPLTRKPSPK